jgi:hypothetical protein
MTERKRMGSARELLMSRPTPTTPAMGSALGAVGKKARAEYVGIMFMLAPSHRDALLETATELRKTRGGRGRANASEVLRALLTEWIEAGAKIPAKLDEGDQHGD